jgi:D-alanyl-D-alanine carboxypeptidase
MLSYIKSQTQNQSMIRKLNLLGLLLSIAVLHSSAVAQGSFDPAKLDTARLDTTLTRLVENNRWMGSIAIAKNGKIIYTKAVGFYGSDGSTKLASTPEVKYRIGSISKMFTAVMIFQLIDEHKLKLETKLSTFFPEISNAKLITIEQMLRHHSGLHSFTDDSDYADWMTVPHTRDQMIDIIKKSAPDFAPGEKGVYSNTNFVLLGYILERIMKSSYAEQLKARITSKIGLKNTYYATKIRADHLEAASYRFKANEWIAQPETDPSIPGGAGSVISTPSDLATFLWAIFDNKLVSKKSLEIMTTMKDGFGAGMFKTPFYQLYSFGHSGSIDGFRSFASFFPRDSTIISFIANGVNIDFNDVIVDVTSLVYGRKSDIPSYAIEPDVPVPAEILALCQGTYLSKELGMEFLIAKADDQLTGRAFGQPAFPLRMTGDLKFGYAKAGIEILFHKNESGLVDQFTITQHGSSTIFARK